MFREYLRYSQVQNMVKPLYESRMKWRIEWETHLSMKDSPASHVWRRSRWKSLRSAWSPSTARHLSHSTFSYLKELFDKSSLCGGGVWNLSNSSTFQNMDEFWIDLVVVLEHVFICPFSWECHHPNWLIFFRGVGIPATSYKYYILVVIINHY
jgi:hypothetical protein